MSGTLGKTRPELAGPRQATLTRTHRLPEWPAGTGGRSTHVSRKSLGRGAELTGARRATLTRTHRLPEWPTGPQQGGAHT